MSEQEKRYLKFIEKPLPGLPSEKRIIKTRIKIQQTMKIWVTRFALTKGIYEAEGEKMPPSYGTATVRVPNDWQGKRLFFPHFLMKNSWYATKEEAIKRAEEMRDKAIKQARKRLAHLETLTFK